MYRRLCWCAVALICMVCFAQADTFFKSGGNVTLKNVKPGTYLLVVTSNSATLEPTYVVGNDPVPSPPQSEVAKQIRALAPNDPTTAANLAALYQMIADQEEIKTLDALTFAIKYGADKITKDKPEWQPVRDKINELWLSYKQEARSVDEHRQLLEQVADGLGGGDQQALDLQMILKIIEIILEILKGWDL